MTRSFDQVTFCPQSPFPTLKWGMGCVDVRSWAYTSMVPLAAVKSPVGVGFDTAVAAPAPAAERLLRNFPAFAEV